MMKKHIRGFTRLEILLAALSLILMGMYAYTYIHVSEDNSLKANDSIRISDLNQIHEALKDYNLTYHSYPACLYKADCSHALEGSTVMPVVAKDPVTGIGYTYAAFGQGSSCTSYHLGMSLERTGTAGSQALLTDVDKPPQPDSKLCTGSAKDFSGNAYAPGGQQCSGPAGIPEPTDAPTRGSCYDLTSGNYKRLVHKKIAPAHGAGASVILSASGIGHEAVSDTADSLNERYPCGIDFSSTSDL